MRYQILGIWGDRAHRSETRLEQFDTVAEATRWVDGYIKSGDFGGYDTIEVIEFTRDGGAITHYLASSIEEDDGQPTIHQEYEDLFDGSERFETCSWYDDW
jgi:hypothetical protein